ncbi:MAG TPA: DUF4160 domain-containing protein [Rhizomicrobium sp.]|jgi:hypothetical protein
MPTLYAAGSWKITMYAGDHNPPHFHIVTRERTEAQVAIATLTVLRGNVRASVLRAALTWAAKNRSLLERTWDEMH